MTSLKERSKGEKWLLVALGIGGFQALGLFGYAISILISAKVSGTSGTSGSDVSPNVLVIIYISFAVLIALVLRGLVRRNGSARTPFLLVQGFSFVVAQALISGATSFEVALGWVLVLIGIVGAYAIMTTAVSAELNISR
ncbi:MAG: hypothetical protein RLZZ330_702 [Actinomycetota bacterium]|jgi:hypothetical protein